ncbi:MAG: lysoplasmalogenase [Myxococcales bacterium]|nr:lysoplasmalogenase [Myxococcales bacterium]
MRNSGPFLLRLGLLTAALYLLAHLLGWSGLALVCKPLPVVCLLGFLIPPRTSDAALIATGLLLSAIGDLLLEASPALFLPGLASFLLAHVCYVIAFFGRTRALHLGRLGLVIALAWGAFSVLEPHLGAMRVPVIAYVVVISAMLWRAAAQLGEDRTGNLRPILAIAGAAMFAISDVMVAWHRFVAPEAALQLPLMLLYWSGQLAITASSRRT